MGHPHQQLFHFPHSRSATPYPLIIVGTIFVDIVISKQSIGHRGCQDMSGTAKTNADIRSAPINHHELSASRTKALLASKLEYFQARIRPRQSADLDLLNWLVDSQRQPSNLKMHITDEEAAELKPWIVKKLENMCVELYMRLIPALNY